MENYFSEYTKELEEIKNYVSITPDHYNKEQPLLFLKDIHALKTFALGNVIKYVCRYQNKGAPKQDLLKASHYLLMLMKELNQTKR